MTRYEIHAVVRGRDRRLGVADDPQEAEPARAAFEAALGTPVRLVPIEQRPVPQWHAEAA